MARLFTLDELPVYPCAERKAGKEVGKVAQNLKMEWHLRFEGGRISLDHSQQISVGPIAYNRK